MQAAPVEGTHRTINQRIDEVYIDAIEQGARLLDYLDSPRGTISSAYQGFKNPFYQLFLLTHNLKEMRGCSAVSDKVKQWFSCKGNTANARAGLEVFARYQQCLFDNLVISRKEGR